MRWALVDVWVPDRTGLAGLWGWGGGRKGSCPHAPNPWLWHNLSLAWRTACGDTLPPHRAHTRAHVAAGHHYNVSVVALGKDGERAPARTVMLATLPG